MAFFLFARSTLATVEVASIALGAPISRNSVSLQQPALLGKWTLNLILSHVLLPKHCKQHEIPAILGSF